MPQATAGVGVVVALLSEARALGLRAPQPGLNAADGVQVYVSGIGAAAAGAAARALLAQGCTALLSFGTAGGLAAALTAGDVVVPSEIIFMDGRILATDATPPGVAGWQRRVPQPRSNWSMVAC